MIKAPDFVTRVIFALRPMGLVTAEEMFGGHAFYFEGYMFGIAYRDRLYFRTNDATRDAYTAKGMQPFSPSPRVTLRDYMEVPSDVLGNANELCQWARKAAGSGNR